MSFFSGKKVLVTGASGFIGSNLVTKLLDAGAVVRGTVHRSPATIDDARVEYISADLLLADDCARCCSGMDIVFHCAAITSGAAVMDKKPLTHLTPNIIMNALLFEAAYAAGMAKTVFISSSTVYPLTDHAVTESEAVGELYEKYFVVGWVNYFAEKIAEMYSTKIKKPMPTVVIRPGNLYGPGDDFEWETSHVLPALIRKVVERMDPLPVWGDGSDIKDFLYIDDFIAGMMRACEQEEAFGIYNIASGTGYLLRDLLQMIIELDGYDNAQVAFDTSKPTMIPKRIVSADKAFKELHWKPETDMRTGLAKTIAWYRGQL